ncbi:MAG: hypothetical protein ACOXZV_00540 [Bacteroidales bacterium]|jgi:hypothetical protein
MENEKIKIITGDKKKVEVVLRTVNTANELPVKPPIPINLSGTLGAPFEFLSKRFIEADQINQKRCVIIVDREHMSICLVINENDPYLQGFVVGKLEVHPKFKDFGINTEKQWTPTELGLFMKMNRAVFKSREDNMKLVTDLMNFKAKVDANIERTIKEKGDRSDNFSQVVNSNLPERFTLNIPVIKGYPAEDIEIETFAQVDGREVSFVLISPSAKEIIDLTRDSAIDKELASIRALTPGIAIIEQ